MTLEDKIVKDIDSVIAEVKADKLNGEHDPESWAAYIKDLRFVVVYLDRYYEKHTSVISKKYHEFIAEVFPA